MITKIKLHLDSDSSYNNIVKAYKKRGKGLAVHKHVGNTVGYNITHIQTGRIIKSYYGYALIQILEDYDKLIKKDNWIIKGAKLGNNGCDLDQRRIKKLERIKKSI